VADITYVTTGEGWLYLAAVMDLASRRIGGWSMSETIGDFVFVSGQTPRNAERAIIGNSIEEQTALTLENLRLALQAAGGDLENVVQVGVHLADLSNAARFNAVYADHFPSFMPARTTVGSALNGVMVEVDAIAYVPHARKVTA
jgi:2-iminobutanoate/2-iminopropanoate deaminase